MSSQHWLPLALFMMLIAAVSLHGLAASGQFPREYRSAAFQSTAGGVILFGTIALVVASLFLGIFFASRAIPWYAAVIGGGIPLLFAPLILRPLPDWFVNGRAALLVFSAAAAMVAFVMLKLS